MPFCIHCGTQLPDVARFCSNCGKPLGGSSSSPQPAVPQWEASKSEAARALLGVAQTTTAAARPESAVARVRQLFLEGARAFVNDEATTPYDRVKPYIDEWHSVLKDPTNAVVELMVNPQRFDAREQASLNNGGDGGYVMIAYLEFLVTVGASLKSYNLAQGAFWFLSLIKYNSNLQSFIDEGDWQRVDALCSEFVSEARETTSSMCLLLPLVKAAEAKVMLRDRRAAGLLMEEFERHLYQARKETPAYPLPGGPEMTKLYFATVDEHAARVQRQL